MNSVLLWYRHSRLSDNVVKVEDVKVEVNGQSLEKVTSYKYLGIKLDSQLEFHEHINYIKGKTLAKIKLLSYISRILDRDTLLLVYKTLIVPIIDYADNIYQGISATDRDILQKLQNPACCVISQADMYKIHQSMICM